MADREKVIKEFEYAVRKAHGEGWDFVVLLTEDGFAILDLLKEQEPVEPNGENCGECGYTLHRINYDGPDKELRHEWFRFCPSCGKAVKWND